MWYFENILGRKKEPEPEPTKPDPIQPIEQVSAPVETTPSFATQMPHLQGGESIRHESQIPLRGGVASETSRGGLELDDINADIEHALSQSG